VVATPMKVSSISLSGKRSRGWKWTIFVYLAVLFLLCSSLLLFSVQFVSFSPSSIWVWLLLVSRVNLYLFLTVSFVNSLFL
jgi:hypothetical protein